MGQHGQHALFPHHGQEQGCQIDGVKHGCTQTGGKAERGHPFRGLPACQRPVKLLLFEVHDKVQRRGIVAVLRTDVLFQPPRLYALLLLVRSERGARLQRFHVVRKAGQAARLRLLHKPGYLVRAVQLPVHLHGLVHGVRGVVARHRVPERRTQIIKKADLRIFQRQYMGTFFQRIVPVKGHPPLLPV